MHCKNGGKNMATKRYIPLQKLSTKTLSGNTTRVSVCSQTQHLLHKNLSFKVNLHTNEDQNHSVQYLHSVEHTKLGHEPYIVHYVTKLDDSP
jgi:hypothetical protein